MGRRRRRRNDHRGGSDIYRHRDLPCKYIAVRKIAVALCTRADNEILGRLLQSRQMTENSTDTKSTTMSEALSSLGLGTVVSVSGTQWNSRGRRSRLEPKTRCGAGNQKCITGAATLPSAFTNVCPEVGRTTR